jgi:hypothetical protein
VTGATRRRAIALTLLTLSACRVPAPIVEADQLLRSGALVGALAVLDGIPPHDPDYAEARALAAAVERRIRVAQRLVKEGLDLRAERRDQDACERFVAAREVWPGAPGVRELIGATESRRAALLAESVDREADGAILVTTTMHPGLASPASQGGGPASRSEPGPELVDEARRRLREGRPEEALRLLEAQSGPLSEPGIAEVRRAALQRRALAAYARGELQEAAVAWRAVLDDRPGEGLALAHLAAIRAELGQRKGASRGDLASPDAAQTSSALAEPLR